MMSKERKEKAIINLVRCLGDGLCHGYHFFDDLEEIIAVVMHYKYHFECPKRYRTSFLVIDNVEDSKKIWDVIERMHDKGIIKVSKKGNMFKLCEEVL